MPNANTVKYTAEEEFPKFANHSNLLTRSLTLERYKKLRSVQTSTGFTIDNVIQAGVDSPGKYKIGFKVK